MVEAPASGDAGFGATTAATGKDHRDRHGLGAHPQQGALAHGLHHELRLGLRLDQRGDALGHRVGASLLEKDQIETVRGYLAEAERLGVSIQVPTDVVVASKFGADAEHAVTAADSFESTPWRESGIGLDIGPKTAERFAEAIRSSATVFWNGPMGVFEFDAFAAGTKAVASALTEVDGLSVVGGGDSAAAVRALGFDDGQFGHISTGGGASLEFLEGKRLPGLEVLGWEA